jgi:hypothetical protein
MEWPTGHFTVKTGELVLVVTGKHIKWGPIGSICCCLCVLQCTQGPHFENYHRVTNFYFITIAPLPWFKSLNLFLWEFSKYAEECGKCPQQWALMYIYVCILVKSVLSVQVNEYNVHVYIWQSEGSACEKEPYWWWSCAFCSFFPYWTAVILCAALKFSSYDVIFFNLPKQ